MCPPCFSRDLPHPLSAFEASPAIPNPQSPRQISSNGHKDRQREIEDPACFVDYGEGVGSASSETRWIQRYAGGHVPPLGSSSRSPLNPRTCSRSSATGHLLLEMRRNLFDVLRGGVRTAAAAAAGRYQKNRKFVTWILLLRLTLLRPRVAIW